MGVSYKIVSDWGTGFVASVTVTNVSGTPISSWQVPWTFTGNQRVTGAWNTNLTQSGSTVTARDLGWNGTLAPNASTTFGFHASYSGVNNPPVFQCPAPV